VHVRRRPARGDAERDVARADAARVNALSPPAMTPCTCDGSLWNVGGHSEASSTPSRPLVPAPK